MWVKELLNEKQERTRRLSIVLLLLGLICSKRRSTVPGLRIGGLIAVRWRKPGRWLLNILNPLRARVHSTQQGALLQRCLIVEVRRFVGLVKEIRRTHPELAEACRSMGLRNDRELKQLTASDLHRGADGHLYAHVRGKGGRERDTLILPGKGEQIVLEAARSRPEGPLFDVPSHANVHGWRADYAARCYAYAMDSGYGTEELYKLRNGSGKAYDKGALAFVSANLGHGPERYYTVCYNYLSYGKAEA